MRTKALLMAAAALAAGIITSNAQVYSQNIVGYVSQVFTNGQNQIVSPVLDFDGTGTNNTITTLFPTNDITVGDVAFVFNGSGYDTLNYKTVGRSGAPGWYLGSTLTNNYPINPGEGFWYSPFANETNVEVGTVLQGTNLANGYFPAAGITALVASVAPESGGITSVLGYNPTIGDVVFVYNGSGYNTYNYKVVGRSGSPSWYLGATVSEPVISAGQGFWIDPFTTTNWVENFVVNP